MNNSGDAADQVVRIVLDGADYAVRIGGAAAKETILLLIAALNSNSSTLKPKGKARMTSMLKSGKPLEIISVKASDLRSFMLGAKQYGIVYCVLRNTKNTPDGLYDIMVKAEDAPKISRLMERFKFATVDKAKIESDIIAEKAAKAGEAVTGDTPESAGAKNEPESEVAAKSASGEKSQVQDGKAPGATGASGAIGKTDEDDLEKLLDEFLGINTIATLDNALDKQELENVGALEANHTRAEFAKAVPAGLKVAEPEIEPLKPEIDVTTKELNKSEPAIPAKTPVKSETVRTVNAPIKNLPVSNRSNRTDMPKITRTAKEQNYNLPLARKGPEPEKSNLSEPTFGRKKRPDEITINNNLSSNAISNLNSNLSKPSVKVELREIAAARKPKEAEAPDRDKRLQASKAKSNPATTHKQPQSRGKLKSKKSKGSR